MLHRVAKVQAKDADNLILVGDFISRHLTYPDV